MTFSNQLRRLRRVSTRLLRGSSGNPAYSSPLDEVQLAIVIPLADQPAREVTKLQIEILRKYGRNPGLEAFPHITLKMGFGATDIRPFEKYVETLASEIPPFKISVKNFETFDDGILFLDVEPNPALETLRQRILEDLSVNHGVRAEPIEGPLFRFHVTLAYGFRPHEFEALQKFYASREAKFVFEASHMDLFCHTGQQWVSYAHAELRGVPKPMYPIGP